MNHPLHNEFTKLNDKTLWFDGNYSLNEEQLCERMLQGLCIDKCFAEEVTQNIKKYNLISKIPLEVKYSNNNIESNWDIPKKYLDINIMDYCLIKLDRMKRDREYNSKAISRILYESQLIDNMNMGDLFRAILFLIDYFKENNVVWGVGRGSSCASYILFIFGLHCVDCIKYDIDCKEFFR
jgi:DNA polymerase III alpha subunit